MKAVSRRRAILALRSALPGLTDSGPARWRFSDPKRASLEVAVGLVDDWALFAARADGVPFMFRAHGLSPWGMLLWHTEVPPSVRCALSAGSRAFSVRGELPVAALDAPSVRCRIEEMCRGFRHIAAKFLPDASQRPAAACERPISGSSPRPAAAAPGPGEEAPGARPDVASVVRAAGWNFSERASGILAVELDVPHGVEPALVSAAPEGGLSLSVELARFEAIPDACRAAIGIFLLELADGLRGIRPMVREDGGSCAITLAALVPTVHELHGALAATAVAYRISCEEIRALRDVSIAKAYSEARNWSV